VGKHRFGYHKQTPPTARSLMTTRHQSGHCRKDELSTRPPTPNWRQNFSAQTSKRFFGLEIKTQPDLLLIVKPTLVASHRCIKFIPPNRCRPGGSGKRSLGFFFRGVCFPRKKSPPAEICASARVALMFGRSVMAHSRRQQDPMKKTGLLMAGITIPMRPFHDRNRRQSAAHAGGDP